MKLIDELNGFIASNKITFDETDRELFERFKAALNCGELRAAARDEHGVWQVNATIKKAILLGFRMGVLVDQSPLDGSLSFCDKDTYRVQYFHPEAGVRVVPGGSAIRQGAYIAPGVVCMPPMYVNVGAYVDSDTMIDSHALIGSCAQIGKRVHVSAGAQIGGVLEPIGSLPVIVEDEVMIGGNCGVYEGTIIRERAVLASGVILTGSTPVFDLVNGEIYRKTATMPLEIPPGAVVVPGARPATQQFAVSWGISLYTPVIVKFRDAKTDAATALEESLR